MGKLYTSGSPINNTFSVEKNAPIDDRLTVQSLADLTDGENGGIAALVYKGMIVYVANENTMYVYTGTTSATWKNKKTGAPMNGGLMSNWKKIDSFLNPADNLVYYQEKLGAKVVDSVDELTDPSLEAFAGMFAVVVSSESEEESEDESGLYVLRNTPSTTITNWYRVLGGSGSGAVVSGLDVADVITFDGSAPNNGSGFSISKDGEFVEEDYTDTRLEGGKYYTSNGINSYESNGGNTLEGVDYITLTNGGTSSIKLNSSDDDNWIVLDITDNSLGFSMSDVTYVDGQGEHQMTSSPLALPKGTLVSFGENDVDFTGMTETRGTNPTEYVFGSTGSDYSDIDIYTPNVLPTVYAYADGTPVRVLTEGDKADIINRIAQNTFEFNVENHILSLVGR